MRCPKCGINIADDALSCPNCKKVLKLKCPICGSINTTNTCQECGYIIISKCHQCGKINPTILKVVDIANALEIDLVELTKQI